MSNSKTTNAEPGTGASEQSASDPAMEESQDLIDLYDGESLTENEATAQTRRALTRRITIAGHQQSGKTTLIASIYDCFNRASFAGYLFAGSRTLCGFERLCHLSRTCSERTEPVTQRTSRFHGHRFLHLCLRAEKDSSYVRDILFSDIAGEEFEHAIDSDHDALRLSFIQNSDHVAILVDGARLVNKADRQVERYFVDALMDSLLKVGLLHGQSRVDVLFTKDDLISSYPECASFVQKVRDSLFMAYSGVLHRLRFHHVCCRDPRGVRPVADGVDALLATWVSDPLLVVPVDAQLPHQTPTEFDRFYQRTLPDDFVK